MGDRGSGFVVGWVMGLIEYIVLIIISVLFRFDLDFINFTKVVGMQLSTTKTGTGYQDAISPPKLTWVTFGIYILLAIFLINAFFGESGSIVQGFIAIGIIFGTTIVTGVIIHPPGKGPIFRKFFLKVLYHSMTNRYADYKKNNDHGRADAMNILVKKFERNYFTK